MKSISLLLIVIWFIFSCTNTKKEENDLLEDSIMLNRDTIVTETYLTIEDKSTRDSLWEGGSLRIEKGELIYTIENTYSFISNPYDFSLDTTVIKSLLGEYVEIAVQEFEGGEDYGPYAYFTITFEDSKISFYDFPGKHFSTIYTPLLPLKNGIVIGMEKEDFFRALLIDDKNANKVNHFQLTDVFGSMDFIFRENQLILITAYYEEGD